MTRRLMSLVVGAILLLSACSAGGPSQPAAASDASSRPAASAPGTLPASTDPESGTGGGGDGPACDLLQSADIVELTGWEVDKVEARSAGGVYVDGCYWSLVANGAVQAEVLLGVLAQGGREHFDTILVPMAEGIGHEPLEGIGDAGLIGDGGSSVKVVVGDVLVDLTWVDRTGDPTTVPLALMERVVANLGG